MSRTVTPHSYSTELPCVISHNTLSYYSLLSEFQMWYSYISYSNINQHHTQKSVRYISQTWQCSRKHGDFRSSTVKFNCPLLQLFLDCTVCMMHSHYRMNAVLNTLSIPSNIKQSLHSECTSLQNKFPRQTHMTISAFDKNLSSRITSHYHIL
jgi:hypothetical protein